MPNVGEDGLVLHRQTNDGRNHVIAIFNFSEKPISVSLPALADEWIKLLDSKEPIWLADPKKEDELSVGSVQPPEITDFLSMVTEPGIPSHILHLKENSLCSLIRNISIDSGIVKNVQVIVQ